MIWINEVENPNRALVIVLMEKKIQIEVSYWINEIENPSRAIFYVINNVVNP